jgi:leucyl/phenylalanyl-tRNA--protein transferase
VPYFELEKGTLNFPPAHFADLDGLLAVGGDMSAERLLLAYRSGIYYWHHPMKHVKWWSPDPRIILEPELVREPDPSLYEGFTTTANTAFGRLLRLCQEQNNREDSMTEAWLSERMVRIFLELDRKGLVHAQEVWQGKELRGGLFGVCLGKLFFGEYVAGTPPGVADYAVIQAAASLRAKGINLMDMHKETARSGHLEYDSMSRVAFVDLCKESTGP